MTHDKGLEQLIRQRAFQIWIAEGQPHGRDKVHWHQATDELLSGTAPPLQPLADGGPGVAPVEQPVIGGNNPDDLTR
jgi:hypothetical protein